MRTDSVVAEEEEAAGDEGAPRTDHPFSEAAEADVEGAEVDRAQLRNHEIFVGG